MIGRCFRCCNVTSVSKKNTQRNGTILWICKPCRNTYQKEWKLGITVDRRKKRGIRRKYDYLKNEDKWKMIAKQQMDKLSLRAQ
jgi:hypothetical protein